MLICGVKGSIDYCVEELVFVVVWEDSSVVFGFEVGLDMFVVGGVVWEDVFVCFVVVDEVDSFDGGFVEDEVDCVVGVVDNVYYVFGEVCFFGEFGEDYGCVGVVFWGFEDECVVCDGCYGDILKWNYSWEVYIIYIWLVNFFFFFF